ncbi:MAG: Aspartate racemase [uncultured Chloroflexi bacterium]|uniref:Aspartate racemase n=1 Tax=uncultured Chloroflexota bacterium TaxID=166587 RepID=A0A6J4JID5_9CHLR|nr:MAG: Aspartate racemase [uncultured Chloroflexota bacterium]
MSEPFQWRYVIGIVGGMGPLAHIEFERQLLVATRKRLGRSPTDQDFPEWIASSIPETPDRTKALLGEGPSPVPWLERSVRRLCDKGQEGGADFAVITCNTAHAFLEEVRGRACVPLVDMIEETVRAARSQLGRGGAIGILGTSGTLRSGIYAHAAERVGGIRTLSLLDVRDGKRDGEALQEELVMAPIYGGKSGGKRVPGGIKSGLLREDEEDTRKAKAEAAEPLREAVRLLADAGADLCVLACTEIPLATGRDPVEGTPLLDPVVVTAEASIAIAAGDRALPGEQAAPERRAA